jgi:sigma54-dependent transcription regulator
MAALQQFRREVRAGARKQNSPTDALWRAAWRELAASCWRLAGEIHEWDIRRDVEDLERDAARIMQSGGEQQRAA